MFLADVMIRSLTCEAICQHEIQRAGSIKGLVRCTYPPRGSIAISEYASQCAMNA